MNTIFIHDFRVATKIGVYDWERKIAQTIRIDLEIRTRQRNSAWSVILLRERRTVFKGVIRSRDGSRTVKLRRTIDDWFGRDSIVVRASGPRLETCRVSATV